jgi:hypothetical protein
VVARDPGPARRPRAPAAAPAARREPGPVARPRGAARSAP